MRRFRAGLAGAAILVALPVSFAPPAAATPDDLGVMPGAGVAAGDDLPDLVGVKRRELREAALNEVLAGNARVQRRGASRVVRVGSVTTQAGVEDQYVELAREKTDKVFVILAQFGNVRHPSFPDQDTNSAIPGPARFEGPLHNELPIPDRTRDTRTLWQSDYNQAHYQNLYFAAGTGVESVKTYYERQSSGRYSIDGQVSDWVKVPYNEARYGRSNGYPCPTNICSNVWNLIRDAVDAWVAGRRSSGLTEAQIAEQLASYDVWDRNDFDHDGDFNEPDGYIDHFQIVHAGGSQSDRDPYGEDAIWAHRWKAFQNRIGAAGPPGNLDGGTPVGATGLWIADYTIQPENGGLSVFAHEYGHDLDLPDEYDAAADNAVNWWSLMATSRVSAPGDQGVGTRAADLGAWDKLQLGWLDYEIVLAGQTRTLELGPHEYNTDKPQGVVVVLPQKPVVRPLGAPFAGALQWWSGTGDDYESSLSRQVNLPAGAASLSFQARWNIEDCGPDFCDYAYVEVDDGTGWAAIPGSITKPAEGNGIDGLSGWVPVTFDLSAYAGSTIGLRIRYRTDLAVQGQDPDAAAGLFMDAIKLDAGGQTVFEDGAETGANGWTVDGFEAVGESQTTMHDHYYIASNRQYVSYDRYLQSGPYLPGVPARPDFVEHFPYQDGLLVSYWDTSMPDNDESAHPGQGLILPIDAHPTPIYRLDGNIWRGRVQTYDAPFSLERADSFTLHIEGTGRASYIRGKAAEPVFDDRRAYWTPEQPFVGVKVPNAGVRIRVQSQLGTSMKIRIDSTR